jgi:hypothetical protein
MVAISGLTETGCRNLGALLSFGNVRRITKLTNHLVGKFAGSEGALGIKRCRLEGFGMRAWLRRNAMAARRALVRCVLEPIFEAVFPVVFVRVPPEDRGAGGG